MNEIESSSSINKTTQGQDRNFSAMERWVLRRAHPVAIVLDLIGSIWAIYFLWLQNWQYALGIIVLERVISILLVWKVNLNELANTAIGKIALLHLHPFNFTVQLVGLIIALIGVWQHSTVYTLAGISLIVLGHFFGWNRIDSGFKFKGKAAT